MLLRREFVYFCLFDPMEQYYFFVLWLLMFWTCAKWFCSLECDKCLASDFCVVDALNVCLPI